MFVCECTPQADGGRVSRRAANQQSVDRKHGEDRGRSPDTMAWGWDILAAGRERWWAREGWVLGQGINQDEGNKGQRGAARRVQGEGLRLGWSYV